MKYLTSKQEETLSPVKREVYRKRLMRDLERRQEEVIKDWLVPLYAGVACCAMWIEPSRLKAMAMAMSAAIDQQISDKIKNEIVSLYEES